MAINFRKIAEETTVLSDIMSGRTKVDKNDGVVTLHDFDILSNRKGEMYAVFAISDTEFINGGKILNNIATEWVKAYGGDIAKAREDLRNSGGVTVKFEAGKTREGNDITKVVVL